MPSANPLVRVSSPPATTTWQVQVLPDTHPYWIELLRRSGIPVGFLGVDRGVSPEASILFLAGSESLRSPRLIQQIGRLRERGAAAVVDARWAAALTGCEVRQVQATGVTGSGPLFESCEEVRLPVRLSVVSDAHVGRVWPQGFAAVSCMALPAPLIILPLPDAADVLAAPPRLVSFPARASEIVSACDHGALRRLVCNALRSACFSIGLPFLRLAAVPRAYAGVLALRVDADGFDASATRKTSQALRRANLRATWFIDVERHLRGDLPATLRELASDGHELQSHFFHHYTYRSFPANLENLRRSIESMSGAGVDVNAAVAPFGSWNPGVSRALAEMAMAYSSEFACGYDDLPGPVPCGSPSVWQIPIHPVCPALLFDSGLDERAVHEYFADRLRERIRRGEPAVFYGHPIRDLERCPGLFGHLDSVVGGEEFGSGGVWRATLGELHSFFRARARQATEFRVGNGRVDGDFSGPAALWLEQPGTGPIAVEGPCTLRAPRTSRVAPSAPEPGIPEHWRPRELRRLRGRGRRIRFARWLHEARK